MERLSLEMVDVPGVPGDGVTWWENCVPGRTDLPRTLPEFRFLGVHEGDGPGLRFVRTPRPGQGTLSAGPTLGLVIVLISPRRDEDAQTLRDWGDFVHIHDIAAAAPEHFTMITPYENAEGGRPRYLHFYELDTDDPEPAFRNMPKVTEARAGAPGTHPVAEWRNHPTLWIDYVSTFRRIL